MSKVKNNDRRPAEAGYYDTIDSVGNKYITWFDGTHWKSRNGHPVEYWTDKNKSQISQPEQPISEEGKEVDVIGEEMYFRNNSSGAPTKIHFIDSDTLKTYCGFSAFGAENIVGDESDSVLESQCCKRCLKHFIGQKKLDQIWKSLLDNQSYQEVKTALKHDWLLQKLWGAILTPSQEAIEFAEWAGIEMWQYDLGSKIWMKAYDDGIHDQYTSKELYQIYLEHKKNKI